VAPSGGGRINCHAPHAPFPSICRAIAAILKRVFLPLLLLFSAAMASALVAYGTHPAWAQYSHGLGLILFARRFEWPLVALAVLLCLTLVALVVAGKRRAWWLIGLGPVLALFVHRYETDPLRGFAIVDGPGFVSAQQAAFMAEKDYVVGLHFEGTAYAYPYHAMYSSPVVFQFDHDKRMVLMWSAFANRAVAYHITHDLYARDLEIVSMPANALLLYNSKLGQFINGLTGSMPSGRKPTGFTRMIPVEKMTWRDWVASHPATLVMVPRSTPKGGKTPNAPLLPWFGLPPPKDGRPIATPIVLIATTQPVAVLAAAMPPAPANVSAGGLPMLLFPDPATKRARVYDRRLEDLTLRFAVNTDARRKQAALIDRETNSGWSVDLRAIDGPLGRSGKRLTPVPIEEGLYWGVMKRWMPELELTELRPVR